VEKDRGCTWNKNQEKKSAFFFWAIFFRGLSFYSADCIYTVNNQALIIIGSDLVVMNALPLLLSY
jgi:hypothetical protein